MHGPFILRSLTVAVLLGSGACSSDSTPISSPAVGSGQAAPAPITAGTSAQAPMSSAGVPAMSSGSAGQSSPAPQAVAGRGGSSSAAGGAGGGAAGASGAVSTAGASGTASAAGAGGDAPQAGTPAAGGGGSPAPSAGGFPRTSEEINIKATGPYKVKTYTEGLRAPEYSSAVMYYPEDAAPPFAAVALAPGYTASGTDYEFMGDMLASHGIAALLTTPTNTNADQPPARGDDLVAAVKHLMEENAREGSPLQGKLAPDRICVTGQSMGGGGSLFAANKLGNMIRCVMPLQPWQPGGSFPMITAATMIIGAASDTTASVAAHAEPHYESIPDSTEKFLVVFQGDHFLSTDRTSGASASMMAKANANYDPQAAYMVPFYKLFLESDERYRPYLYGAMRSTDKVTRFESSKKQ